MTGVHAKFAPSSMDRTVACPGWIQMSEGIVQPETDETREGQAAHTVLESVLYSIKTMGPGGHRDVLYSWHGQATEEGVVVTDEMIDAVELFVDIILKTIPVESLADLVIEKWVDIHTVHPSNGGTPDVWCLLPGNTLHVFDFKYGHRRVSAFENWQIADYTTGILVQVYGENVFSELEPCIKTICHVVQPRCYDGEGPHLTWSIPHHSHLRGYINIMSVACADAETSNPTYRVGLHCRDCPGNIHCSLFLEENADIADRAGQAVRVNNPPEVLGYELTVLNRAEKLIKERKATIESSLLNLKQMGYQVPGWMMKQGYGARQWQKPDDEIILVGELMGVNLKETKPCSPAEADRRFKSANVDASVIKDYYGKKPTSLRLVPDDGSRAKMIFNQSGD